MTQRPTPLDELLATAPGGPWSDRAVDAAGGPTANTLRSARHGRRVMRTDSIARLARTIGVPFEVAKRAAELTAEAARAQR